MYATGYRRRRSYWDRQRASSLLRKPRKVRKVYSVKEQEVLKRLCRDYGLISDGGSVVERYALKQEQVQVAPGGEFMLREDVVCFVVENYLVDVMRLKFGGFTRDLLWCAFLKAGAEFYACYVDEDETVRVDDLMMDSKVEFVTGERCWLTRRVRME